MSTQVLVREERSSRALAACRRIPVGLLAVAILALPYLGFLGSHRLWAPFEPELVETAREMRASGNLVVPCLNGRVFADKPPLYYWSALTAASARGRLDETAARLPSAISLLLLVYVTATFGERFLGRRAGFLAGLVFGSMPLCFNCGTSGMCDMPLALAVTAANFAIYVATCEGKPRGWALVVAGALAGVSMLAKSVLGPVLIVLATVPALAMDKDRRLPGLRWWLAGVAAFVVVVLPWFVAIGAIEGRGFLFEVLVHQTFDRFVGRGDSKGAFFNYLGTVPGDIFPWTIFIPLGVVHAVRARRTDPERWRKLRFLLVGIGVELLFLSVSKCRIDKYALPLLPQIALFLACALDAEGAGIERRLATIPAIGLAALVPVAAVALAFYIPAHYPAVADTAALGIALALPGGVALYFLARTAPASRIAGGLALLLVAVMTFVGWLIYPAVDTIRTNQSLEQAIVTNVGPGTPYASYGLGTRARIIFYTERTNKEFFSVDELARWIDSFEPRNAYVLTKDAYYYQLAEAPALTHRVEVVGRNPPGVGDDDFCLVRVRAR